MVALTSFPPPEEGIVHKEENTEAHITSRGNIGTGTLYIAESRVSWRSNAGEGFSLEYKAISLHAVSRDLNAFPRPCLYIMLDADIQGGDEVNEDDEEADPLSEIRFVPAESNNLDTMFKAMSDCQQLHPDTDQSDSEEDFGGEGEFFTDDTGANVLTAAGQDQLDRLNAMISNGGGDGQTGEVQEEEMEDAEENQFDDAEMDR